MYERSFIRSLRIKKNKEEEINPRFEYKIFLEKIKQQPIYIYEIFTRKVFVFDHKRSEYCVKEQVENCFVIIFSVLLHPFELEELIYTSS